jgi:hypothetical protein
MTTAGQTSRVYQSLDLGTKGRRRQPEAKVTTPAWVASVTIVLSPDYS